MSTVPATVGNAFTTVGRGKPNPFHLILDGTLREVINRRSSYLVEAERPRGRVVEIGSMTESLRTRTRRLTIGRRR